MVCHSYCCGFQRGPPSDEDAEEFFCSACLLRRREEDHLSALLAIQRKQARLKCEAPFFAGHFRLELDHLHKIVLGQAAPVFKNSLGPHGIVLEKDGSLMA